VRPATFAAVIPVGSGEELDRPTSPPNLGQSWMLARLLLAAELPFDPLSAGAAAQAASEKQQARLKMLRKEIISISSFY
jgi:hypothetical protein